MESSWWWKLSEDVQGHILKRIPGRELMRLKLVSWEWYYVISYVCSPTLAPPSPDASLCGFIFRRRPLGPLIGRFPDVLAISFPVEPFTFRFGIDEIMRFTRTQHPDDIPDCCNGILLAVRHNGSGVNYSVSNPMTGQSIQVPPPPDNYHTHQNLVNQCCCFASLTFDPTKSFHYKIISTPGWNLTNPLNVETFSSETWKWSKYVVKIDAKIEGVEWIHRSASLDGRIYRLLKTNYLVCIGEDKSCRLLSVQAIRLPYSGDCNGFIGVSRGSLHYSTTTRDRTLLVYILKDDVRWLLKHTILVDEIVYNPLISNIVDNDTKELWFHFCCFHPNNDSLFLLTHSEMYRYNPGEKYLRIFHFENENFEIALVQNHIIPFSLCPVILQSAFQRV